jgi:pimeloyl-ACP methyl ester carboxylesterase
MAIAHNGRVWLHWEEHGRGEPVLMIMGLSGSSKAWFRLLPVVAGGHRAIVFDNRGTGLSDPPAGLLTMDDLVEDTLAVMDAAGIESAHVIGVSMGGMIAQHLALEHRERVRSLLLGCTTPGGRRPGERPPWRLLTATALRPVVGITRTFPLIAPLLYSEDTLRNHPERIEPDMELRLGEATPVRTSVAQMAAIAGHDVRDRLAELAGLPVTVLHGEDDRLVPPDRGRELAAGIPGAQLVLLPRTGHLMTSDAPRACPAAVLDHLTRAAAGVDIPVPAVA